MCLFLPFVFLFLVVGCWFYSEINNNTHNQQPTTNNRRPTTNNQTAISISEIRIL